MKVGEEGENSRFFAHKFVPAAFAGYEKGVVIKWELNIMNKIVFLS